MRLVLNLRTEQEQWYGDDVPPERAVRIAWLMEHGRVMDMHDEARIEAVSVQRGRWSVCCGDWSTLLMRDGGGGGRRGHPRDGVVRAGETYRMLTALNRTLIVMP